MNTAQIIQIKSGSDEITEKIASSIGLRLKGGEVIELVSDLGGGKTTFVRGLAVGFGSNDRVSSPSFTISKVYKSGSRELHHYDFYRLATAGLMSHELSEVLGDKSCVVVVEWGEVVRDVLPEQRLTVHIYKTGQDERRLEFSFPRSLNYLVEDLC